MQDRWKFQVVTGSVWATVTLLIMGLFYYAEGSIKERWHTGELPVQIALIYICGIFLFGWMMWSQKAKQNKKRL